MKKNKLLLTCLGICTLLLSFRIAENWYLFETPKYSILFPAKPGDDARVVNSAAGPLKLVAHMYPVTDTAHDANLLYGIAETEYPEPITKPDMVDSFFSRAINGAVTKVKGKLISEKVISKNNYPGREIKVDYGNGMAVIKMRMFLVKKMSYSMQTITYTAKQPNAAIDKFMNSFTLKD